MGAWMMGCSTPNNWVTRFSISLTLPGRARSATGRDGLPLRGDGDAAEAWPDGRDAAAESTKVMDLLTDLQVVDCSSGIPGGYCAKLLTGAGAEVIKVEAPDGDPLRRWTSATDW